jgi:hypothetical protein
MTFFAKWRDPANIMVGACPREMIPLQPVEGETIVVMNEFHPPHALYVDEADGELRLKADGRAVGVDYLDDETLADLMIAATELADPDWRNDTVQRLKGAQTFAEAHAAMAVNGVTVDANDLAKARHDRQLAETVIGRNGPWAS